MKKVGIILLIIAIILIICGVEKKFLSVTSDDVMIHNQDIIYKKYHNISMCHTEEN